MRMRGGTKGRLQLRRLRQDVSSNMLDHILVVEFREYDDCTKQNFYVPAQTKNARLIFKHFGKRAAMSFPALADHQQARQR